MPKAIDISGKRFGNITVIKKSENKKHGRSLFECKCDCGTTIFILPDSLKRQKVASCGRCLVGFNIGKRFGKLVIIKDAGSENRRTQVLCQCDCGNIKKLSTTFVVRGLVTSCGCRRKEVNTEKATKKLKSKFFYLRALKVLNENGVHFLLCKCKCGNITKIKSANFGLIKSCGCYRKEAAARVAVSKFGKITLEEANSVREIYKSNLYSIKELSNIFGISANGVRKILKGKSYKSYDVK